jgi:ABC-type bacteriocin/lantibiotic exporter with double-glycine peptidase domain
MRQLAWTAYEKTAIIGHQIQDSISGVEVIKAFRGEQRESTKIGKSLNELKETNIKKTLHVAIYSEAIGLLGSLAGLYILWRSGINIIVGSFTLGSYLAFSAYFAKLLGPTQLIAGIGLSLQPAKVALLRIEQLMKITAEDDSSSKIVINSLKGEIVFHDVYFSYEAANPILSHLNMIVQPGDKVVITGPNGSGKSTIIKLILSFYDPQQGNILLDGIPIQNISKASIRERISIVAQNTFLFNDTIRNNVMYSFPAATPADLSEAIRLSGAQEIIHKLPLGLDSAVGERGILLSGGEKQKLSIARAILKKSDVIIFDEATTHLDGFSVNKFRELFEHKFKNKTCILISHENLRIPCINRVFSIRNGQLQEVRRVT